MHIIKGLIPRIYKTKTILHLNTFFKKRVNNSNKKCEKRINKRVIEQES